MSRTTFHNMEDRQAIAPVDGQSDDTAEVSAIIDTLNRESMEFVINLGVLADTDATFAVTMDDGDAANLSDAAAVAASDLLGTLAGASFTFAADDETRHIGYIGPKRYVRMTITPSSNTGSWPVSAMAVLSHARRAPVQAADGTLVTQVP